MTRLFPHPFMSVLVALTWLMLNQSADAGHVLLALLLAVVMPLLVKPLWPEPMRLRAPLACVRLAGRVFVDIIVSNVEVARRILGPESAIKPRFVRFPLALENPYAIVTLAGIITMTPGTLTADIAEDRRSLLVHAFNVEDEEALIESIRDRYETLLARIFP